MKLLTKELERKIPALYSTEEIEEQDKQIICKFFALGSSWTWYVVEGERQEDGDYLFYGLVNGFDKEWGYFSLRELESVRVLESIIRNGIPGIERDLHFGPVTVGDCIELSPQPT